MTIINTHIVYKELVEIGISKEHAEIFVNRFATKTEFEELEKSVVKPSEFTIAISDLRHDISDIKNGLNNNISELKNELKLNISDIKWDILKWIMPLFIANIGVMITLLINIIN